MALFTSDDDRIIFFIVIIAIIFFMNLPAVEKKFKNDVDKIHDNIEKMTNTYFHNLKCSKDCCNHTQYLPKELHNKSKDPKYIGSNLTCDSGCLCVEKKDMDILTNRGSNKK